MKLLLKKWFTLLELIVAITISALVLIIIFHFVSDTVIQLAETNKKTRFLGDFARFTGQFNVHTSTFPDKQILINEPISIGYDVLLLKNIDGTAAMLWGVVDGETGKLVSNADYDVYKNAVLWYRLISSVELLDITATPSLAYNYEFFGDKTFLDFTVKSFQVEYFNSTDIINIDLDIGTNFEEDLVGLSWNTLPQDSLFEVNMNF